MSLASETILKGLAAGRVHLRIAASLAAGIVLVGSARQADAILPYEITHLGTLSGGGTYAYDVNASGQVVGLSGDEAFLWADGTMEALGMLPGGWFGSEARAINDSGVWVGRSDVGLADWHAVWSDPNGEIQDLNDLLSAGSAWTLKEAWDINNNDVVVGYGVKDGSHRAYSFHPSTGVLTDLGFAPGGSAGYARAVGESDRVVGDGGWGGHMFICGSVSDQDLSPPWGQVFDIGGDWGVVTGMMDVGWGNFHAFKLSPADVDFDNIPDIWFGDLDEDLKNDLMRDLGTLAGEHSYGLGISPDTHVVVGWSTYEEDYASYLDHHAFACEWSETFMTEVMYDLNNLLQGGGGWTLVEAWSVNADGKIVGWGKLNGEDRGFVLVPIPEPATLGLLCLAGLAALRRRG